jgi:hypothetical protein
MLILSDKEQTWKDQESLFCSPNLKNIIDKEPLHIDGNRKTKTRKK